MRLLTRLDRYVIRRFLTTFFYMIAVFCVIAVVFDLMENIGRLIENEAPLGPTILYYLSFCFHFGNLLSGFIVFLTIIWFTSRLAQTSEIIAMLSGGMSYWRFLRPYFLAASVLVAMSLAITHYILPRANASKVDFEFEYVHVNYHITDQHLYREIAPGTIAYFRSITLERNTGYRFQLEQWDDRNRLKQRILAAKATYIPEDSTWRLVNASIRDLAPDGRESLRFVNELDTVLPMEFSDFGVRAAVLSTMTTPELAAYIEEEAARGSAVAQLQLDLLARTANPFAIYVLTLIGVAIASRKVRGGVGVHLFFAVLIGFTYVFTAKLITVYAAASPVADGLVGGPENRLLLAAWLPNLLFAAFGIVLVARAPK